MIGSFGDIIFEISDKRVFSLNNEINRSYKSKVSEHNPVYGPGMLRHQGRELAEVSFSITLNAVLTPNLVEEKQKLIDMWEKGEYGNLVFGGQVFGEFPFLIMEISEKNIYFDKEKGIFDVIELSLNVKEYIENPKLYNEQLEAKKIKAKEEAEIEEVETESAVEEQKTKLDEFKNKVDKMTEKINKGIEVAENKKKEIMDKLEHLKQDYKVREFMELVKMGMITADKIKEMTSYSNTLSETNRGIFMNVIRNYLGGM